MTIEGRVDTWFEEKFSDKVKLAFQQMASLLRSRVFADTDVSDGTYHVPVLGKTTVTKNKPSALDQDVDKSGHTRPSVTLDDYTLGRYVAKLDQAKMTLSLNDKYVETQAAAAGREIDKIILDAIDLQIDSTNRNTDAGGLTYEKVTAATKHFYKNVVSQTAGKKTLVVDEEGWEDLALETEFANSDFVSYRVAETGTVPMVSGHEVVVIDPSLIPNRDVTTAPTYAYAFHGNAVNLPIAADIDTEINYIPTKFSDFIGTSFSAAGLSSLPLGTFRIDVGQS